MLFVKGIESFADLAKYISPHFLVSVEFVSQQPKLVKEQFIKFEPGPGFFKRFSIGRKMNIHQGIFASHKFIFKQDTCT